MQIKASDGQGSEIDLSCSLTRPKEDFGHMSGTSPSQTTSFHIEHIGQLIEANETAMRVEID